MFFSNLWIRAFLAASVLGLSAWGVNEQLILPKAAEKEVLDQRTHELKVKITKTLSQFPDLEKIKKELARERNEVVRLRTAVGALDRKVLEGSELESLLEGNGVFEKEKHLRNLVMTPGQPTEVPPYAHEIFQIGMQAPFDKVVEYINSLEKRSKFLRIHSVKMGQTEGDTLEPPEVSIEMEAVHAQRKDRKTGETPAPPEPRPDSGFVGVHDLFLFNQKTDAPTHPDPEALVLTDLIFRGQGRFAVINGELVKEGDVLSGKILVKRITDRQVLLNEEGIDFVLDVTNPEVFPLQIQTA